MDYKKIYDQLIEKSRSLIKSTGTIVERHHVVPHSLGGTNDPSNIAILSTREHYVAHLLLVKITKDDPVAHKKMIYALWWMSKTRNNLNGCKVNSWAYAYAREQFIRSCPNKDPVKKARFIKNRKAGLYKYDDKKMGQTLSATLKSMSTEEMNTRIMNSFRKCDDVKRGQSIKRGKSSILQLEKQSGETVMFATYDDVVSITGYTMQKIQYHMKRHNGVLPNGNIVRYIQRYTGNDSRIGSKVKKTRDCNAADNKI